MGLSNHLIIKLTNKISNPVIVNMKVKKSLKSLRQRKDCKLVRRGKHVYVICKTNPRFKAKQA